MIVEDQVDPSLGSNRSPDLSPYLIHFVFRTKGAKVALPKDIGSMSPAERLQSIVHTRRIRSSRSYWSDMDVCCLTESTRAGAEALIRQGGYEPWAIGFHKASVYELGGGPVFNVRQDEWDQVEALPPRFQARCVRYNPLPGTSKDSPSYCDWSHEREWRTLGDLRFQEKDLAFIMLPSKVHIPSVAGGIPIVRVTERTKKISLFGLAWP